MTLNQLKYFDSICRYGTVMEASRRLHISQPSLTASIRQLEQEYHLNLFHRSGRKLILTREGEQFLVRAREILKKVDDTETALHDLSNRKNHVLLGIPPMIGSFFFPPIFSGFSQAHPEISLELREQSSRETCKLLMDEELELAVTLTGDVDTGVFQTHPLHSMELCCFVGKGHPLAGAASVSMEQLRDEKVVLLKGSQYHIDRLMAYYQRSGFSPSVILRSSQLATIKRLTETGGVISFLFRESIPPEENVVALSLDPPLFLEVGTVYKKGHYLYSDASLLLEFIHGLSFGSDGDGDGIKSGG